MTNRLKIAVVCSSNQNRSMEAHDILSKKGFDVKSYGTGTVVKLPGPGPDQSNIYEFGTPYEFMYADLFRKDPHLCCLCYTGHPLVKGRCYLDVGHPHSEHSSCTVRKTNDTDTKPGIKSGNLCPCSHCKRGGLRYTQNGILHMLERNKRIKPMPERFQEATEEFDIIFTVEERIYDAVLEDLESRGSNSYTQVQVINLEVKDNHEDATLGAFLILELCNMIKEADDIENEIEDIVQEFEVKKSRTLLHTVAFY